MFLELMISLSVASSFIVKAPEANSHEFAVYQQNSNFEKISKSLLQCESTNSLSLLAKQAQFLFLEGSLSEAKSIFREITDKKWDCDWSEEDRKIIVFSEFRLAELSASDEEQSHWIREAISFDEDISPNINIFPPPIIEKFKITLTESSKKKLLIPSSFKKFNHILRNGKFISLTDLHINLNPSRARYTFVSDTYLPEHLITSLEDLAQANLQPHAMVSGNCQSFQVADKLKNLENLKIFFSMDCIREAEPKSSLLPNEPQAELLSSLPLPEEPTKKSWLQRNALLVGATALGTALLVHYLSRNTQDSQAAPTTTIERN